MFIKHGVGGEAGAVKKGACIGRDRINQGGGLVSQDKKVSVETLWVVMTTHWVVGDGQP